MLINTGLRVRTGPRSGLWELLERRPSLLRAAVRGVIAHQTAQVGHAVEASFTENVTAANLNEDQQVA